VTAGETRVSSALRGRWRSRPGRVDIGTSLWRHYGWQTELFFKWIKQHLRIKAFYGTSENAVKIQVWIAISVYVLVAIVKKELRLERSLTEILQILSLVLFEKTPIFQALSDEKPQDPIADIPNQMMFFDL